MPKHPIAVVNGKETPPRKITNHMFAGPDHSVIHPGIFPHNDEAVRDVAEDEATSKGLATIREWLSFDHEAGWGSKDFEKGEWKKKKTGEQLTPLSGALGNARGASKSAPHFGSAG